jgi:hypothetical protein
MKNLSLAIAGAACVALGGVGSAQAATLIDTTPPNYFGGNLIGKFGEGSSTIPGTNQSYSYTTTYGQTFTVGSDNILNDFTFWLNDESDPGPVDFAAYVMAWDGTKATGGILYDSGKKTTNGGFSREQFTFNTGGTTLNSGQQYVAFLSASNFFDGIDGSAYVEWINTGIDVYSGGNFVYAGNGSNFSQLTTNSWSNFYPTNDLAFKANLSSASAQPVPEPSSSLGLLAFGGFVAGKILKRKKAQLKIESQDKE